MTNDQAVSPASVPDRSDSKVLGMILGIAALLILLQGVWAGVFMNKKGSAHQSWVDIHGHMGEATALVAVIAFVWALVKLRDRRDVLIGTAAFAVVVIATVAVGMAGKGGLVVHLPLALCAMGLAVWLPTRLR